MLRIANVYEIPQQELEDSVQVLEDHMHLKVHPVIGCKIHRVEVSLYGLEKYLEVTRPDFAALIQQVALQIVNEHKHDGTSLFAGFDAPVMVFRTVIQILEDRGFIKTSWYIGGSLAFHIMEVSPQLRRALQQ